MNWEVQKLTLLLTTVSMKMHEEDTNVIHSARCRQSALLHHH